MNEALGGLAIASLIILGMSVSIYFIFKMASYFKQKYGKSLWPGTIALCSALDLLIISGYYMQEINKCDATFIAMITVSISLLAFTIYRDIKYYHIYSIWAFLLQALLTLVQFLILLLLVVFIAIKNTAKYRQGQLRQFSNIVKFISNI